jgi:putative sterol carrier protein
VPLPPTTTAAREETAHVGLGSLLASFKMIDEDEISVEELEHRAQIEAETQVQLFELKRKGRFIGRPLAKRTEPQPKKAHWDYLLQEMVIVSEAMARDRKLKIGAAKKSSKALLKLFETERERENRSEREEEKRLRKIASSLAKDVMRFWKKIEKVANLKKESRQKELRSAAMDRHLDFIVGETEKYSNMLAEKLVGAPTLRDLKGKGRAMEKEPSSSSLLLDVPSFPPPSESQQGFCPSPSFFPLSLFPLSF